jgi:hypothetical protein
MPKGMRTLSAKDISNEDLLNWLPTLEAVARSDTTISSDAPILEVSALSFARVAECAVEQHSKSLRQGSVTTFRRRARYLIESTLCEALYLAGHRSCLNALNTEGVLPFQRHVELMELCASQEQEVWRTAANGAALILRDIEARIVRKEKVGRPKEAQSSDVLVRLFDSEILKVASDSCGLKPSKSQVDVAIPRVVRKYLEDGKLRWLGSTEKEAVDRHSKRLRVRLHELIAKAPVGGSSIIRKPT